MINNSKWLNGRMFLHRNEESWPGDLKIVQNEMSDDDPEVKPDLQSYSRTLAHRANEDFLSSFIQPHSSWEKLKRTVAWLLIQRSKNASVKMLSVDKLQRAEREIVKHVQGISFPEALQALQKIRSSKYSHQLTAELKRLKTPAFMRKLASPVVGRISNPKGRRALWKRTHQLRSQTPSCSLLSASYHRSDNVLAVSEQVTLDRSTFCAVYVSITG